MPDYVLPDIPLFESFTRLGKNRRLRAIKFNFSTDIESSDPVYSMGIVLPMDSVLDYETIVIEKYDDRIGRFVATEPNAFKIEEFSKILGIEYCGVVFCKLFKNIEELRDACESYFKNNLVEGIVVGSYYGTAFSLKYMNLEYDSKK